MLQRKNQSSLAEKQQKDVGSNHIPRNAKLTYDPKAINII